WLPGPSSSSVPALPPVSPEKVVPVVSLLEPAVKDETGRLVDSSQIQMIDMVSTNSAPVSRPIRLHGSPRSVCCHRGFSVAAGSSPVACMDAVWVGSSMVRRSEVAEIGALFSAAVLLPRPEYLTFSAVFSNPDFARSKEYEYTAPPT